MKKFVRAIHRLYADPGQVCSNQVADRLFHRLYWALRTIQFKIFYKNEELDVDEFVDRWEVGVQPPSLDELARTTRFNRRWIKYMYAKFKNECPSGRMREQEFRNVLSSIIAPEKATDQYISRLFLAFSSDDKKTVTFQEFLSFTQAVFGLSEGRQGETNGINETNKETVQQRATTVFNELDSNGDGLVTLEDMTRFFESFEISPQMRTTTHGKRSNTLSP
ncbi:EF hand [Necator americanus]|uniref:EF hand n=1 Tax=Necator americanus TaxID=51031 RepID=W2T7P2_NECAM|nr:EF hand [Necator americanus]ETN77878.1 EF hand [Necator americanus]